MYRELFYTTYTHTLNISDEPENLPEKWSTDYEGGKKKAEVP